MRIATLRAPAAPVTSASPIVIMTASTLPAEKASIEGEYSNHSNSVSTPASLNHPFWMAISYADQPGQSLNAMRSGGLAGAADAAAEGVADAAAAVACSDFLSQPRAPNPNKATAASTRVNDDGQLSMLNLLTVPCRILAARSAKTSIRGRQARR